MLVPSGSYRVSLSDNRLKPFPPKPTASRRKEIYSIIEETFTNLDKFRTLTADLIEDLENELSKITFNNYNLIDGRLQPSRIKENYLYVNNVYVKKSNYIIYEEDNNLIAQTTNHIGYRIEPDWTVTMNIRAGT